jgi:fatty acid synthase, animal type
MPCKDTPFRGWLILDGKEAAPEQNQSVQKVPITEPRPIWFVYSGMGSQWAGMGQKLMAIPLFDKSLRESSETLREFGLDVYGMLQNSDPEQYQKNTLNCMLAITSIQASDIQMKLF